MSFTCDTELNNFVELVEIYEDDLPNSNLVHQIVVKTVDAEAGKRRNKGRTSYNCQIHIK